ncbi:MAG TPA: heparinase II/III family protein, partial [Armatimonadota bacterium]|nr:heparinase II/III family protein [Armatimonadota bacterium]
MTARRAPRNAFEAARLAKVLSVDPNGITRCDIDGRNRQQVFAVLHSFDHVGLPAAECIRRTLALLDLPGADAPDAVRDAYRAYYADLPARLPVEAYAGAPAEADAILEHRFTFNGVTHQLPDRIDWNADPGDCPHWPWEFNRFGFLRTLLGAFAATGERAYAEKAVQLILAFIADTDIADSFIPGPDPASWRLSVHKPHIWLSHLEVGFHLVAWGQALAALLPRIPDLLAPVDLLRIIKSVHDQLRWLEIIIPEGGHGNGLTSGAGCQLRALAHFPGLRDARALATVALDRLAATLDIQVLPDGVQHRPQQVLGDRPGGVIGQIGQPHAMSGHRVEIDEAVARGRHDHQPGRGQPREMRVQIDVVGQDVIVRGDLRQVLHPGEGVHRPHAGRAQALLLRWRQGEVAHEI